MQRTELQLRQQTHASVWLASQYRPDCDAVFTPVHFPILSVGTSTVHLEGHSDIALEYCYSSYRDCLSRCRDLFTIYTGLPREKYPNL
jgi:hypothetical protein